MPDDLDWSQFKMPGQPQVPKPPPAPSAPGGLDWSQFKMPQQAQQPKPAGLDWSKMNIPAAKPKAREDDPGFWMRSLAKTTTGKSASDLYDKYVTGNLLPKEYQGNWGARFMLELGRAGPEVLDAATSPAGMGLIAAHLWPASRPIAVVADSVLGVMQGVRTIPSLWKMGHDFTPENAAIAAKDILFTYGMLKGSKGYLEKTGARESQVLRARAALPKLEELKPVKGEKRPVRLQKEAERTEIWNDLMKPATTYEKLLQKAYSSRFSGVAKLLLPRPADVQVGAELVSERQANINTRMYAKKRFVEGMQREVPVEDQAIERMGYAIQEVKDADKLNLSQPAQDWIKHYRKFNQDTVAYMKDAYGDIPVQFQDPETYLAQVWDFDKTAESTGTDPRTKAWFGGASRRLMRDPFMKSRSIIRKGDGPANYKEAIEDFGWVPRFKTVPEVIDHRWNFLIQAAENQRMARRLRDIGAIMGESKARKVQSLWPRAEDATPLYRAAYSGKREGGLTKKGTPRPTVVTTQLKPVFVHPAIKHAVNAIYGKGFQLTEDLGGGRFRQTPLGALENIRAWSKQSATMTSLFHNWAEMSQSMAIQAGQMNPKGVAKAIFVADPKFWNYLRGSIWDSFGKAKTGNPTAMHLKPEAVMDWMQAGVNFTSTDREEAVIRWMRDFQGRNKLTKAMTPVLRTFGNLSHAFNKALWDYYLPGQMLNASETIMTKELARLGSGASPEAIKLLRREIATHVNRVFGTETLESLLISPKGRQALSALFFAPVWTMSNVKILAGGYESETQQRLRNKWAVGAAMSFFISTQLMNYATTAWFSRDKNGQHDWKGKWTWQSPGAPLDIFGRSAAHLSENSTGVYVGPNEDGSEGYVRMFKGESEIFGWMMEPRKEFLNKLSQPIKVGMTLFTGRVPGSDYQAIGYGKDKPDEIKVQQVSEVLSMAAPFWTESFKRLLEHKMIPEAVPEGAPTSFFSLPQRKGLTVTRATEAYKMAKERGDTESMKAVLEAARRNRLRVSTIVGNVRREATQRRRTAKGPRIQYNWKQRLGLEPLPRTAEPPSPE